MVESRVTDGERIAELLAAEIEGRSDGGLGRLSVTNVEADAEPGHHGDCIFDVVRAEKPVSGDVPDGSNIGDATGESRTESSTDELVATAHVHDDRIHLALRTAQEEAHERAAALDLRTRPKATTPPQTLVFVESGAEVKRAVRVFSTVGEAIDAAGR